MDGAPRNTEWARRRGLSIGLRLVALLGPIAVSVGVAEVVSRLVPQATSWLGAALWIAVIAASSLFALVVVERAARRLLPLAALLNVSLVFPDAAPKRFAVARKSGNPRDLAARLESARRSGREQDAAGMQSVIELVLALSVHDKATRGHSERVRVFADMIARELKLEPAGMARLPWAALLHDVGKLEVAPEILNKPGRPDDDEWKVLHRHPEEGARIVAPLLPWLGEWGRAVVEHHERYDGMGYPHGLKGDEISLAARIVSVADTYEVMTAPRPYKRPMSATAARRELTRIAGTQLDPMVVRAFLNISLGRLWRTVGFGAWLGQVPTLLRALSLFGRMSTVAAQGIAVVGASTALAITGVGGALTGHGHGVPFLSGGPLVVAAAGVGATPGAAPGGQSATPGPAQHSHHGSTADPTSGPTAGPTGAGATPGPASTPQPTTGPRATDTPQPTVNPTPGPTPTTQPTPQPTPTPTPTAAPTPTPNPNPCAACTNTSPSCTSYCHNNDAKNCITWCQGNNNRACTSQCYGNNNRVCLSYCWGSNNKVCQSNCNNTQWTLGAVALLPLLPIALGGVAAGGLTRRRGRNRGQGGHARGGGATAR